MEGEGGAQRVRGGAVEPLSIAFTTSLADPSNPTSQNGRSPKPAGLYSVAAPWLHRGLWLPRGYPAATPRLPRGCPPWLRLGRPPRFFLAIYVCLSRMCRKPKRDAPKALELLGASRFGFGPKAKGAWQPRDTPWLPRGFPLATPGAATTFVDRMPGHLVS